MHANSGDPDVTHRLLAILRKDLKLGTALSQEAQVATPVLDAVSKATDALDGNDLNARWQALWRDR